MQRRQKAKAKAKAQAEGACLPCFSLSWNASPSFGPEKWVWFGVRGGWPPSEKRGQKWARNSSPFLEPSSIGTITEGSENGPIFGPAFWCRRTTPELVLGVANLGTDREMPSNATSSSLDAAGQGKRPVTACLEHTFAFNSQVETCCVYSLTNCSRNSAGLSCFV